MDLSPFLPLIPLLVVATWIWALADCVRNPRLNDKQRVTWLFVIVLLSVIGAVLYFALGRNPSRQSP